MSVQWGASEQHGANRAAAKSTADGPVEEPAVSSSMLEVALGQPSPKIQPISSSDSSSDEEFVDAAGVGAVKSLSKSPDGTHDSRAGADDRGGGTPVVDYTPGRKPSWHIKNLFRKEQEQEEEEEVVSGGIFPSVQVSSTSPTAESSNMSTSSPPRPQPLSSPVLLAYSSRRELQAGRKSPPSGSPPTGAVPPKSGAKNGSTPAAETTPLRGIIAYSPNGANSDAGRAAPKLTTPVGPRTSHAINPIKVATVASRDAWFSSPSGRPAGSGEIAAELAALAATRGASSRLQGDAIRAGKDAGEGGVRSGRVAKAAETFVPPVPAKAASHSTTRQPATESGSSKPPPPYLGVVGAKQKDQASSSPPPPPPPPPFDASAVGVVPPPSSQPSQSSSQSSPLTERSISLKAAAILGVSAPDLAGGDQPTPGATAAETTSAAEPIAAPAVPAVTTTTAAAAQESPAPPAAAVTPSAAERSASLTETEPGKKRPPQKLPSFGKALSSGRPGDLLSRWRSNKKVKSASLDNNDRAPASADAAAGSGGPGRTSRTPFRRRSSSSASKQRRHSLPPRPIGDEVGSSAGQAPGSEKQQQQDEGGISAVDVDGSGGGGGGGGGDSTAAGAVTPGIAPPPRPPGRARARAPVAPAHAARAALPTAATPSADAADFPATTETATDDAPQQVQERVEEEHKEEEEEEEEEGLEPVAVIGQTMSLKGLLECGRSVKMEGSFSGDIVSTGDVIVAPTGRIAGDLKGLKFLLVEGEVTGDVVCDKVMVVGNGKVFGDITSVSITLGPQATMRGRLNVVRDMDELLAWAAAVDEKAREIEEAEKADEKARDENNDDVNAAVDPAKEQDTVEDAAEIAPADDADADDADDAAAGDADAALADAESDSADDTPPADSAPVDAAAAAAAAGAAAAGIDANFMAVEVPTDSDAESEVSSDSK